MAQVLKRRRLVNPARRRRRRMTAKQIKYFGTARQRAALKHHRRRRNAGPYSVRKTKKRWKKWAAGQAKLQNRRRRKNQGYGFGGGNIIGRVEHAAERAIDRIEGMAEDVLSGRIGRIGNRGRRRNVGEILTVVPANPGRRRRHSMARRRRRRLGTITVVPRRRRRRSRVLNRRHRRRSVMNPRVVVRYRNRRRHRLGNRRRHRNPGFALTGNTGAVVGILGGAAVTKIITGFLPSTFTTGFTGMLATAVVATATGQFAGRMLRNRSLGNWMTVGGLLIVGLQLVGQFFPQFQLPFGLTSGTGGMGLISSSNFYVPQVNLPGSMASFVTPAGIPAPVVVPAAGMRGLGAMNQGLRRVGRLR